VPGPSAAWAAGPDGDRGVGKVAEGDVQAKVVEQLHLGGDVTEGVGVVADAHGGSQELVLGPEGPGVHEQPGPVGAARQCRGLAGSAVQPARDQQVFGNADAVGVPPDLGPALPG
jgi:hypothetical protein